MEALRGAGKPNALLYIMRYIVALTGMRYALVWLYDNIFITFKFYYLLLPIIKQKFEYIVTQIPRNDLLGGVTYWTDLS